MLSKPARGIVFTIGLYCMGLGVALAVISGLGTSPISCLPYVVSQILSCSIGTMTFCLNVIFLILQIVILRHQFRPWQILQIPGVFLFSAFIDLNVFLCSGLTSGSYIINFVLMLLGCVMLGLGIALLLIADFVMMPGDALIKAIADTWKKEFGKVKVCFDVSLVIIAAVVSLLFLHGIFGIREGSLVAALTVGLLVKLFCPILSRLLRSGSHPSDQQ